MTPVAMFGFLNCNKPAGMTSRYVVNIAQRRLRKIKVGHAGTLDPLAEGVLVLGVGPASRLVPYVQQLPKFYRAMFRLGESSISGDLEGKVTKHPESRRPTLAEIRDSARNLVGKIQQTPPAHSAVWVDGKRAYKRIRAGESFEMPSRTVEVYSLEVRGYEFPQIELEVVCGSGTYIRSLGIDLAAKCGSQAVMSDLCRHGIGPFAIEDSFSIEQLRSRDLESMLIPATVGVEHLRRLEISEIESKRLGHGLRIQGVETVPSASVEPDNEAAAVTAAGDLRAIVLRKGDQWRPYRVFPTHS